MTDRALRVVSSKAGARPPRNHSIDSELASAYDARRQIARTLELAEQRLYRAIVAAYRAGLSPVEIAERGDLTWQRVNQILKEVGAK